MQKMIKNYEQICKYAQYAKKYPQHANKYAVVQYAKKYAKYAKKIVKYSGYVNHFPICKNYAIYAPGTFLMGPQQPLLRPCGGPGSAVAAAAATSKRLHAVLEVISKM